VPSGWAKGERETPYFNMMLGFWVTGGLRAASNLFFLAIGNRNVSDLSLHERKSAVSGGCPSCAPTRPG
jgi:hypothetical protein